MSIGSPEERRKRRAEVTKQALADIVRVRLFERRLLQKTAAGKSGISRSHLRALLRAEKQMSLFIFLELSDALGFDDACQLLRCAHPNGN
jgi:AraC-like DNA-binding protein